MGRWLQVLCTITNFISRHVKSILDKEIYLFLSTSYCYLNNNSLVQMLIKNLWGHKWVPTVTNLHILPPPRWSLGLLIWSVGGLSDLLLYTISSALQTFSWSEDYWLDVLTGMLLQWPCKTVSSASKSQTVVQFLWTLTSPSFLSTSQQLSRCWHRIGLCAISELLPSAWWID